MSKVKKNILILYFFAIVLISIYIPCIVQKSQNIGPTIRSHTVTEFHFVWNIPKSFESTAIGLDWRYVVMELFLTAVLTGVALYSTLPKHNVGGK